MKAEGVLDILEREIAPVSVSDEFCSKFKMYDNSGLIINCGKEISGILFSLDLSEASLNQALSLGYNLIVTHHPAIYGGISRFDLTSNSQARAIATCLKEGVSVISMHLNFDAAEEGIDHFLMCGLGGKRAKMLSCVSGGAYGRVYEVDKTPLDEYIKKVANEFNTTKIICHGQDSRIVKKVASFCGAGLDDAAVEFIKNEGANVAVSSDLSHHRIAELVECNVAVIQLTHYCAESYGFGHIYNNIEKKLGLPSAFFRDARFV